MTSYAAAWDDYLKALAEVRESMESHPACADPKIRDAALYLPCQMQAAAFNMYIAPLRGRPILYQHQIFSLFEMSWGLPNPDYVYRFGFLDGRRNYRITGPRKSPASWFNLQAFTGWWGDKTMAEIDNYEINDFVRPDGTIEILMGPGARDVPLPAEEHDIVLNIREAIEDWKGQTVTPLRIECLDEDKGPFLLPEAELAERIGRAAELVRGTVRRTRRNYERLLETAGGENRFFIDVPSAERAANTAHLVQTMVNCIYHVEPGQALIIEADMPESVRYWGIQLGDVWWRTVDYAWHVSSLNRRNAYFGPDGKFWAVVSHEDPGIQNWLDPVDNNRGQILNRLNQSSNTPLPRTQLVPIGELRKHLPDHIPAFTAEQRAAQIAMRTDTSLARFGY